MSGTQLRAITQLLEGAAEASTEVKTVKKTNRKLERALRRIITIATAACAAAAPAPRKGRRSKLAEGSLGHRLVKAAAEPQTLAALIEGGGARAFDVRRTLKQLEGEGHIERVGAGRKTKYVAAA